ncbi:MAG: ATP-binding cassette domain-containing protein, partial [Chloroflexi bacterium]|nr:ATP-binding cassette domain-containing protein [Chloroflexota bacterium]
MASVTLDKINKVFGSTHIIKDVDLAIGEGEFVVFVGPSGCGKSTLLRLIAGLESITDGELSIGDQVVNELPPRERGVGMVFQSYALYPHMTVYENMAFGLKLAKTAKETVHERVMATARILQLEELLE